MAYQKCVYLHVTVCEREREREKELREKVYVCVRACVCVCVCVFDMRVALLSRTIIPGFICQVMHTYIGWLRLVGSLKS